MEDKLNHLEKLTNGTDGSLWHRKSRSRTIVIEMKASEQEKQTYQNKKQGVKTSSNQDFGTPLAIRTSEFRTKITSAQWPLLFQFGSKSSLTATYLSTWPVESAASSKQSDFS